MNTPTKRFRNLRAVAILYKILGAVAFLAMVIGMIGMFASGQPGVGLAVVAGSIAAAVTMFALAESIDVILAIEENTRQAADSIASLSRMPETAPSPMPSSASSVARRPQPMI